MSFTRTDSRESGGGRKRRLTGLVVGLCALTMIMSGCGTGVFGAPQVTVTATPPAPVAAAPSEEAPDYSVPNSPMSCLSPAVIGTDSEPVWLTDGSDYVVQMAYKGSVRRMSVGKWAKAGVATALYAGSFEAVCPSNTSELRPLRAKSNRTKVVKERTIVVVPGQPQRRVEPRRDPGVYDELAAQGWVKGNYCKTMFANGWSFDSTVQWYISHGRPSHMDADGNGVPCETVYPPYMR